MLKIQKDVNIMKKNLYLIRQDDGYLLCHGKPIACKPYQYETMDHKNYYTFGGCDCIPIPEDSLVNVSMEVGDDPIEVRAVFVGDGNLKKEATKSLIRG